MPALEALAAGCKVILTDTGFARDLKRISGSVVVIPVNPNTQEVTEAIDLALSLPYPKSDVIQFFSYQKFLKECVTL